jgi:hypothetical protein
MRRSAVRTRPPAPDVPGVPGRGRGSYGKRCSILRPKTTGTAQGVGLLGCFFTRRRRLFRGARPAGPRLRPRAGATSQSRPTPRPSRAGHPPAKPRPVPQDKETRATHGHGPLPAQARPVDATRSRWRGYAPRRRLGWRGGRRRGPRMGGPADPPPKRWKAASPGRWAMVRGQGGGGGPARQAGASPPLGRRSSPPPRDGGRAEPELGLGGQKPRSTPRLRHEASGRPTRSPPGRPGAAHFRGRTAWRRGGEAPPRSPKVRARREPRRDGAAENPHREESPVEREGGMLRWKPPRGRSAA